MYDETRQFHVCLSIYESQLENSISWHWIEKPCNKFNEYEVKAKYLI